MDTQYGEDRNSEAVPSAAPSERTRGPVQTLEVDGETFELRQDGRGGTSYDWLSGPNEGYGFGSFPTDDFSLDNHRQNIRDFLNGIDPATGFIGD